MEEACPSETSVDFQQTTWCYIPEDSTLQMNPVHILASHFGIIFGLLCHRIQCYQLTHHYHIEKHNEHRAIPEPHAVIKYPCDGGPHKGPKSEC
jgi:hypothetical protein